MDIRARDITPGLYLVEDGDILEFERIESFELTYQGKEVRVTVVQEDGRLATRKFYHSEYVMVTDNPEGFTHADVGW